MEETTGGGVTIDCVGAGETIAAHRAGSIGEKSMSQVTKAVIPAAGLGTRFLPATKAQPKEMLPVVDKPAIQYVVEEAVAAGIDDILIITGRGKHAIEDHFDRSVELEHDLHAKGKDSLKYYVSTKYRDSIKATNKAAAKYSDMSDAALLEDLKAFAIHGAKDSDSPAGCN